MNVSCFDARDEDLQAFVIVVFMLSRGLLICISHCFYSRLNSLPLTFLDHQGLVE